MNLYAVFPKKTAFNVAKKIHVTRILKKNKKNK